MEAQLIKFRITKFRSIQDSGWVELNDLACLVGTNESGKTNLLIGLSKLKPANKEAIIPLIDYPRAEYYRYETEGKEKVFITAEFKIIGPDISELMAPVIAPKPKEVPKNEEEVELPAPPKQLGNTLIIERRYNGLYNAKTPSGEMLIENGNEAQMMRHPWWAKIPSFVYYSDYGNLDSEIYLPEVVQHLKNINNPALTEKKRAKARTLKVLFEFLALSPDKIMVLGREADNNNKEEVTQDQEHKNKQERDILLKSASFDLTKTFRAWWKQGDYNFRFAADGSYFRIWVSDSVRKEDIELENRSRGLQWFFSFFIVFLVESKDNHNNCILLLDEPGLTLHPKAQADLLHFFEALSHENQLIYSTHSPFMVNPDRIGDVVAVYVSEEGETKISKDLREGNKDADKSIYPIHAAIGLSISDTMLLGSTPVLVEGPSDQILLNAIKNVLIREGKYQYGRELVFIPTGGVRGMGAVKNILLGREGELPFVVLDSDKPGKEYAQKLLSGDYKDQPDKVISMNKFLSIPNAEIEDLLPREMVINAFSRRFPGSNQRFFEDEELKNGEGIVDQMEAFATKCGISLHIGWKVELANDIKHKLLKGNGATIDENTLNNWMRLFEPIIQAK